MNYEELEREVFEVAKRCARRGPGSAMQSVVLGEVAAKHSRGAFAPLDLQFQQAILTCWHDLFRKGYLSWGYDLLHFPRNPFPPSIIT